MYINIKHYLKKYSLFNLLWALIQNLRLDFVGGRFRGVILVWMGNMLPDLLFCAVLRALLWRLAGVRLSSYTTSIIRKGATVEYPKNLLAGKNFQVNRNSYFGSHGLITIGDDVTISSNVSIFTISHAGKIHEIDKIAPVYIGNYAIIYSDSLILPGAVISEGVVIAAGSVLRGSTEPWCIYAGVPAKRISNRVKYDLRPPLVCPL